MMVEYYWWRGVPLLGKETNGTWEIGAYDASGYIDDLVFTFCTDENYNNGTNTSTAQINFLENGTIAAGITGNAATESAGTITPFSSIFPSIIHSALAYCSFLDG